MVSLVTKVTTFVADALCMFIEKSLLNSGLDKVSAKALAKSACTNIARPVTEATGAAGGKLTGKVINKVTRKKTKRDRVLSQELAIMNKRFRYKNGQLRKGATQSKIMSMAQKATTKRMRK